MRGKNKCKILKQIRQQIAEENDIPLVTKECTYQGECSGTCPRCEAELRYLEQQLARRQALGKAVTVAALSVSLMAGVAGCGEPSQYSDFMGDIPDPLYTSDEPASGTLAGRVSTHSPTETAELIGEVACDTSMPETAILELDGDVAYVEDATAGAPTAPIINWEDGSFPEDPVMGALEVSEDPESFPTDSLLTEFEGSYEEGGEDND